MKQPKVSIIVPCYNVEAYLPRCMDSLLGQTLREIEIILVDDESPDRVPAMCDEYARQDSRVKVVHKPNGGLGFARNSGLDVATGEYVAFVDSDDYVETAMYATLYAEARQSGADVVFSNFYVQNGMGKWNLAQEVAERTEWSGDDVHQFLLDMVACAPGISTERRFQMSVWHSLYDRSLIEKCAIRFHSEREVMSEDFPFQMDFLRRAQKVVFLPEAFYHYCSNGTSLTHTFDPRKFQRSRTLYELMGRQLEGIADAQLRLDRFYIGYVRSRIQDMVEAGYPDGRTMLRQVMDDALWTGLRVQFPPSCLPLYPRLVYRLILVKYDGLLLGLMRVVLWVKSVSRRFRSAKAERSEQVR